MNEELRGKRILAIETSAHAASCCAICDGRVEASAYQDVGLTHSRTLMPMIRDMLANAGLSLADFGYIAVAQGPGSFTGIRIGIAAAKGLALGAGLNCIGVSTLASMARLSAHERGIICCSMDARRGEVYNALFLADGGRLERLTPDRPLPAEDAVREALALKSDKMQDFSIICIGDGAELCYNLIKDVPGAKLAPPHLIRQSAIGVAFEAEEGMREGHIRVCTPAELEAVYLRLSQAERERARRGQA